MAVSLGKSPVPPGAGVLPFLSPALLRVGLALALRPSLSSLKRRRSRVIRRWCNKKWLLFFFLIIVRAS